MHGDRYYKDDKSLVAGIASFNGKTVTVIGNRKGKNIEENIRYNFGMASPEGYTLSAAASANAPPLPPSPVITDITGTVSLSIAAILPAIALLCPLLSASMPGYAYRREYKI